MLHFFTALQTTITASGKLEHPAKQPNKPHHPELPPYNNFPTILSPTLTLVPKFACCILPSQVTPTEPCSSKEKHWITPHMHSKQTWNSMNSIYDQKYPKIKTSSWHILQNAQQHPFTARRFYLLDFAVLSGWNRLQLGDRILSINSGLPRNKRKK